jgi:hypothetical protein
MADEANDNAAEGQQGEDATDYGEVAFRYLSRSRKSLDLGNRPGEEQANYYLSAAQVYAILDLAQAIRES